MARFRFKNEKNEEFVIGMVSFDFLDKLNVFDEFSEDDDYYSELILLVTSKEKINALSEKILVTLQESALKSYREDIYVKLTQLAEFLSKDINELKVTVD